MKENILIFVQGSQRSVFIESMIFELKNRGHEVIIGSIGVSGGLQEYLTENGFTCYTFDKKRNPLFSFYYYNYVFWKQVIKKHNIEIVFSHLQWANFVALMIGVFSFRKLTIIPTRHHIDASFLHHSKNRKIEDVLVNLFAKKQVVVSEHARKFMLKNEYFAKDSHIFYVPLGYKFENYEHLQNGKANLIRRENEGGFLLVMISRLIKTKRHELIIEAMSVLKEQQINVRLMILDDGPEKESIIEKINALNLNDCIKMYGHQKYIADFLIAADLLVQPSIEESSNQVVKEAAIHNKTAIVTQHIGDFDEYILDKENAFFIKKEITPEQLANLIKDICNHKYNLSEMALKLNKEVRSRFDIMNTVEHYLHISRI